MRFVNAEEVKELLKGLDSLPWEEEVDVLVDRLETVELPVRGEWIYTPTYREYECSNCKSMINLSDDANAHLNFCPQCGADMRKKVKE